MVAGQARDAFIFLRWRLVALRKSGELKNRLAGQEAPRQSSHLPAMDGARSRELGNAGWIIAPSPEAGMLHAIADLYTPRAEDVVPTDFGHPFGDAIFVDPAACYPFGSRCKAPRTAVFITFNTHLPYSARMEPLSRHRARAASEAKKVRPDLPHADIDRILPAKAPSQELERAP